MEGLDSLSSLGGRVEGPNYPNYLNQEGVDSLDGFGGWAEGPNYLNHLIHRNGEG